MRKLAKQDGGWPKMEDIPMRGLVYFPLCFLFACAPMEADSTEKPKPAEVATPKEWKQPDNATMAQLAANDPIAFLENCIHRYNHDVHSYRLRFHKKE